MLSCIKIKKKKQLKSNKIYAFDWNKSVFFSIETNVSTKYIRETKTKAIQIVKFLTFFSSPVQIIKNVIRLAYLPILSVQVDQLIQVIRFHHLRPACHLFQHFQAVLLVRLGRFDQVNLAHPARL